MLQATQVLVVVAVWIDKIGVVEALRALNLGIPYDLESEVTQHLIIGLWLLSFRSKVVAHKD
jgi:hypothetical protein